jgi:UDPglucose--hexose-1-phosphate uridylyltransferase
MLIRGQALRQLREVKYITFFKQHKWGSMMHSHSQIITTPFVPNIIESLAQRAHHFRARYGKCCVCAVHVDGPLSQTMASERLVFASAHFVVSVPFAAREAHRMMIAPRRHDRHFLNMTDEEVIDLAAVLRRATSLYYFRLKDPPFSLAWFTCPVQLDEWEDDLYRDAFHWYIVLYPRLKGRIRGLQSATDIVENKVLPEDNAAQLRQWLVELDRAEPSGDQLASSNRETASNTT